jgi:hypothetical protein
MCVVDVIATFAVELHSMLFKWLYDGCTVAQPSCRNRVEAGLTCYSLCTLEESQLLLKPHTSTHTFTAVHR